MPAHPARARKLLAAGRAVVASRVPFVIRLKDRKVSDGHTSVQPVGVGIDPGSRHTGMAVFTLTGDVDRATGELTIVRRGMFAQQLDHRGREISNALTKRAQFRRGRRTRNLRYRAPRFNNRPRPEGWLAPSLHHRVDGALRTLSRLRHWFPVTELHQELVRFDLQKLENQDISGDQYQQGELAGFEIREYLLEKYHRACVYCDAQNTALNLDHVVARSRGGTNRVRNLVTACIPCNQAKGAMPVEDFVKDKTRLARILAGLKKPLHDAAAVNSTRNKLHQSLLATGLPVHTGTGGRTKYLRHHHGIPKTHVNDALVTGRIDTVANTVSHTLLAKQTGRGSYARTRPDKHGFPRLRLTRTKQHYGFTTGDLVRAVVPTGKKAGTHTGRVAVRATGFFNITTTTDGTVQGISHQHCTLIQCGNGWQLSTHKNLETS